MPRRSPETSPRRAANGISRPTFYRWYRRYEEKGLVGLRDRSRRPHVSPNATQPEIIQKIIYLRANYHFGPEKIQMYLKRYHDITISRSGIWRISSVST
jgi:transposase